MIAAEANADLSRSRYWLPLAGLAAVALVLLAIYRSPRRALVPLVPIVLATGWSALVVAVINVPLNPMSATLGALVIAIATEFSVILSARFERERGEGLSVGEALRRTYALTGTAVLASGVTAIAGFAALAATDIRMLRDFGLVTVADLSVALVGVMLVLPGDAGLGRSRFGARPRRGNAVRIELGEAAVRGALRRRAAEMSEDPDPRRERRERARRPAAIYSAIVGLVFIAIIAVAGINALQTEESGVLGAGEDEGDLPLAQFAVPDLHSELEGDANIAQDDCEVARVPCPEDEERTPACEVEVQGAIRVCDLFDRPLVLSFWFTKGRRVRGPAGRFETAYRRNGTRRTSSPSTCVTRERRCSGWPTSEAGRTRSGSTATAPFPTSTGWAAVPPSSTPTPAGSCTRRRSARSAEGAHRQGRTT